MLIKVRFVSPLIFFATVVINSCLASSVTSGEKLLMSVNANYQIVKSLLEAKKLQKVDNEIIVEPCNIDDFHKNVVHVLVHLGIGVGKPLGKDDPSENILNIIKCWLCFCLNKTFNLSRLLSPEKIAFLTNRGIFSDKLSVGEKVDLLFKASLEESSDEENGQLYEQIGMFLLLSAIIVDDSNHVPGIDQTNVDVKGFSGRTILLHCIRVIGTFDYPNDNLVPKSIKRFCKVLVDKMYADVDHEDHEGNTLLHIAARNLDAEMCQILVEKKAKIKKNTAGDTPLHVAISPIRDSPELLFQDEDDTGVLDHLVVDPFAPLKEKICTILCELITEKDFFGNTALHRALIAEKSSSIKAHAWGNAFIERNKQVLDVKNSYNQKALHVACIVRSPLLKNILKRSTETLALDIFGNTPVHYASASGASLELFEESGKDVDVSKPNSSGWAPLHMACYFGNNKAVEYLISKGIDINIPIQVSSKGKRTGKTALMIACERGHLEICKILASRPTLDKDAQWDYGGTALDCACESDSPDILSILFNCGFKGQSPLHCAQLLQRACHNTNPAFKDMIWKSITLGNDTHERGKEVMNIASSRGYIDAVNFISTSLMRA